MTLGLTCFHGVLNLGELWQHTFFWDGALMKIPLETSPVLDCLGYSVGGPWDIRRATKMEFERH